MYENGLTSKQTLKDFKPNESLTREQAAKFFSMFATRIYNKEIETTSPCLLYDITTADKTLVQDIQQACALEIMKGNKNKFSPKKKITYAEAITTIIRIMYGKMDEPQNAYYTNYYNKAKEIWIIGNVKIKNNIRRGDIALIMYKASLLKETTENKTEVLLPENIWEENGLPIDTNEETVKTLAIPNQEIKKTNKNITFSSTSNKEYLKTNIEMGKSVTLFGLSINADIQLWTDWFVRVVVTGKENNTEKEYLIYEESAALAEKNSYSIKDSCDETCLLPDGFTPQKIYVEIHENSSIKIQQINIIDNKNSLPSEIKNNIKLARLQLKANKAANKLGRVKRMIAEEKLSWKAGMTPIANMSYQEKKDLFVWGEVPDLMGFEYYIWGIFEKKKGSWAWTTSIDPNVIQLFDRRTAHGKNLLTPVKNQGACNSSRTFSVVGAVEGVINAYTNNNIGLNLSEQDIISNSNGWGCESWYPSLALDYIKNYGIVDEQCFIYAETESPEYTKCANPINLIKIWGRTLVSKTTETEIKKALIDKWPLNLTIRSLNSAVVLIWFETDNEGNTIWIFKNSRWSSRWEYGYGKIKTSLTDLSLYAVSTPLTDQGHEWSIICEDKDQDGYCNRGISPNKASSCPTFCKLEKDCDDSNAEIRARDEWYKCWATTNETTCTIDQHVENNTCVDNTRSCTIDSWTWTQTRSIDGRSVCMPAECNDDSCRTTITEPICSSEQHLENNICVNNTRSCIISNWIWIQRRDGTTRGTCTVISCNFWYKIKNNSCVVDKAAWNRK
jgi:C1A family cysteine protease